MVSFAVLSCFSYSKFVSISYLFIIHILISLFSWMSSLWLLLGDGGRGLTDAQTSLPDFTIQGFSLFCCHRDRLLPENIAHLCLFFFFFFFSEYSLISSVFPNQIESWRAFSSSLFTPVSALFVTNKSYSLLQEESLSSGSIFF